MGYLPIKKEAKNKIIKGITSKEVTDNFFTNELFVQDFKVDLLILDLLILESADSWNFDLIKLSAAFYLAFLSINFRI
jgi:hypothetical protein